MTVIAVGMVRDEADIIGYTLAQLLAENVDRIIVADNRSTDHTRPILDMVALLDPRVTVVDDNEPGYYQSQKISALAQTYAKDGDWVIPFDADELWHSLTGKRVAETLRTADADIVLARPYVHIPHPDDNPKDLNPYTRVTRRARHPESHPKIAVRWRSGTQITMGYHGAIGAGDHHCDGLLGVRHFQYRTLEQTARKVRNGAEAFRALHCDSANIGTHWKTLDAMTPGQLEEWWQQYLCSADTIEDPAPWRRP